jgi:hypothetical protein
MWLCSYNEPMQTSLRKLCSPRLLIASLAGIFGPRWVLGCLLFISFVGTVSQRSAAQSGMSQAGPLVSPSPERPRPVGDEPSQFPPGLQEKAFKMRNEQRQKPLVSDTGKLLALARELEAVVDSLSVKPVAPGTLKKAEEVEKLARSVKDKMKAD